MIRILFIAYLLVFTFSAQAQSLLFSLDYPSDKNHLRLYGSKSKSQDRFWNLVQGDQKTLLFQFNDRAFFLDSTSIKTPKLDNVQIAGTDFSNSDFPILYWSDSTFNRIVTQKIAWKTGASSLQNYVFQFKEESFLHAFQANSRFGMLTMAKGEPKLIYYDFVEGKPVSHILDFSTLEMLDAKNKRLNWNKLWQENPIEIITPEHFTPLYQTVGSNKLYIQDDRLLFTFESYDGTHIVEFPFTSNTQKHTFIPYDKSFVSSNHNSFVHRNELYQINTNKSELSLVRCDLNNNKILNTYRFHEKDTLSFANSPFFHQKPDNSIRKINKSKRFLRLMDQRSVGLSVNSHKDGNLLVTIGAVYPSRNTSEIALGTTLSVGVIAAGGNLDLEEIFPLEFEYHSIYFESILNPSGAVVKAPQPQLYIDALNRFLEEEQIQEYALIPFRNFYILSYYSTKEHRLYLRKFSDRKILD